MAETIQLVGTCALCAGRFPLHRDGTVREHVARTSWAAVVSRSRRERTCYGSGELPRHGSVLRP